MKLWGLGLVALMGCGPVKYWPLPQITHYDTRGIVHIYFDTTTAIEIMAMVDEAVRENVEDARCLLGEINGDTLHIHHAVRARIYGQTDSTVSYACRRKGLVGKAHVHLVRGDLRFFSPAPGVHDVFEFYGDPPSLIQIVASRTPPSTTFVVFALRDGRTGYVEWSPDGWR